MRTRILYVDHADLMGGAEHSLLLLMAGLDSECFEPILACNADSALAEAASDAGITVCFVRMGALRGRRDVAGIARTWYRGVSDLRQLIAREGIQLVHSNVMRASLYAAPAARLADIPLVWHVRDIHRERVYLSLMGWMATRIVAISGAVAAPLPAWSRRKVTVIPNGLDLSRFVPNRSDRGAFRDELGIGKKELLIGNIGWLAPWKQPDLFLEMARRVAGAIPNSRFIIVGEAAHPSHEEYVASLKRQVERDLSERFIFAGARSDLPRVLSGLDLLVHTAKAEPFGRVIIEAMTMSLPVVAFGDGGVPEIVADDETGSLVTPGDENEMAATVIELLNQPEKLSDMGAAGRRRAATEFSAEVMVRRVESIYDSVLGGSNHDDA